MANGSKCTIAFDNNPFGVYYAGQIVSGTAELITTRPKTIRSIFITVSGFAEVRWVENITKQNNEGKSEKAIETYSSSEMYYSSEKYVYGQSGGSQLELPAGKYVFPFQATIPPNAPTSFNGASGQIQHEVTLVIDRVMRYNNTFKQAFTVLSPYDLNLNPDNAKPLQKIEEKTFCWSLCCGNKGPMIMKVNVPFSAYAPGQKIRFNIVLDNQSDVNCSDVKVRLIKHVIYTSRSPQTKTQTSEIKVADNHCGEVVKLNKAEFNEFLQIPSTTPSSLASCSIIKTSYSLRFIAKTSRLHGDLVIDFPFTIGTVPLFASTSEHNSFGVITTQPGSGPAYKPLPPPMFEEDVRSEQFESNTFKPRYPVFLTDANLSGQANGNNSNPSGPITTNVYPNAPSSTPMPQPPTSVYPKASISTPLPQPPTPQPQPQPIVNPSPKAPVDPRPPTIPIQPSAPPASVIDPSTFTKPTPKTQNVTRPPQESLEVLGFSIPPDYEPTPSSQNDDKSGKIGWN